MSRNSHLLQNKPNQVVITWYIHKAFNIMLFNNNSLKKKVHLEQGYTLRWHSNNFINIVGQGLKIEPYLPLVELEQKRIHLLWYHILHSWKPQELRIDLSMTINIFHSETKY